MKRLFAIPILFFIAFLAVVYFVLPQYTVYGDLKTQISNKKASLAQRENYFVRLQEISVSLEKYQSAIDKINTALPDEPFLPLLLDHLQIKASENGLILESISQAAGGAVPEKRALMEPVSQAQEKIRVKELFVQLNLIGSVFAFENFLKSIEQSARLIEVESASLKTQEDEFPVFSLLLKAYSY